MINPHFQFKKGKNMNMEKDLSVIIPFAGEYPQVLFTIQAVAQELIGTGINFEVIAVDNYCMELEAQVSHLMKSANSNLIAKVFNKWGQMDHTKLMQSFLPDMFEAHKKVPPLYSNESGEAIEAASKLNPWLVYMKVEDRLSHWECKRRACDVAKGKYFLFLDAHTVPSKGSLLKMVSEYNFSPQRYFERGTFHMPLTYKILETHRLIYKMKIEDGFYGYSFTKFPENLEDKSPYEVPCMSTCGMLISREIYNATGGWPKDMMAYGGGENFINYTLSVLGYKKWIYQDATLFHHGGKRDYHFTFDGMLYNRMVAHYLFGGLQVLKAYADAVKGDRDLKINMVNKVMDTQKEHRYHIREKQKMSIEEWVEKWNERYNEGLPG